MPMVKSRMGDHRKYYTVNRGWREREMAPPATVNGATPEEVK